MSMKRDEYIARYGQAKYDELLARKKARLSTPEGRASHAAYMRRYYAKKKNGAVRSIEKRGLTGVADGTYWKQWAQLPDVKEKNRKKSLVTYYALTPEQRLEVARKRRAARKAKLASDAVFRAEQAAKQAARSERWNQAHPGERLRRSLAWFKAHPEVVRAAKHARRALGKIPVAFVKFLREQPCLDCGKPSNGKATIGHLIPVSRGGTNNPLNLITQCRSCNSKQCARVHPRFAMVNYPQAARYAVAA